MTVGRNGPCRSPLLSLRFLSFSQCFSYAAGERDDSAASQGKLLPQEDSVAASGLAGDEVATLGRAPAEPSGADVIEQPLPSSAML